MIKNARYSLARHISIKISSIVIKIPNPDTKATAYWYLGRIAHLLADVSVPAHVHNDIHIPIIDPDSYEDFMTTNFANWDHNSANQLSPIPETSNLDELFQNLAQRAQYFPSNDSNGDTDNAKPDWFLGWPDTTEWNLWHKISNSHCEQIGDRMMPLAIQYTAALYKLFYYEFNIGIEGPDTVELLVGEEFSGIGKINGSPVTSWEWDFDYDGTNFNTNVTGQTVTRIFDQLGEKKIALRATASGQAPAIITKDIYVEQTLSSWHTFYGQSSTDYGNATATDGSGNVYVTGYSAATWNGPAGQSPLHAYSGSSDIFVLKLDSSGSYRWHTFYGGGDYMSDEGLGIAIDGSGNLYVMGGSSDPWNGPAGQSPLHDHSGGVYGDIVVLKLNSNGSYQWHTFYGAGSSIRGQGHGIATDVSGNVYVTGENESTWNGPAGQSPLHDHSGGYDIVVLKLNSNGSYQWHTFYGGGAYYIDDEGLGIATDVSGNLYVMGRSGDPWNGPAGQSPLHAHTGYYNIFVLKLNSNGSYQWHTFYGGGVGLGIAIDGSGNLYVTGSSATWNGPAGQSPLHAYSGNSDIFVLKLDSSGSYRWHTFYGSSIDDVGIGIATDGSGNVYVTGDSYATWNGPAGQSPLHAYSGNSDIFVLKLDSSGSYRWHTFYGSDYGDYGYAAATDGSGNVYVTGGSYATWNGPAGQSPLHDHSGWVDIFVLKLSGTITVNLPTYTLTAWAGSGGSISPSGTVTINHGANQTFSITPNPGYHVVNVLVDGASVGAVTSYPFNNVTASHTISATFAINTYTVTASVGGDPLGGSVTPSSRTVNHGASATFTVTTNVGYTASVSGGTLVGSTWTIPNVTSTHTATVTFTITVQNTPNLSSYQPAGWSDKIVISKTTGTNTDSSPLYTTDTLYIDWAVINNGSAPTSAIFYTKLYVDGVEKQTWPRASPLNVTYYTYLTDYSIGSLSAGTHTIKIVVDSTNAIVESNEADNEYTKTITVRGLSYLNYLDTVQKVYIGYYQRPADPGGLLYWAARLDVGGGNLNAIIEAFANSAESQALYGTINSSNISTVVNGIYDALFCRNAEAEGLSYYVNGFNNGTFTAATIMLNVLYGAQNEDLQSINNKLTAANLFTRTIDPELDGANFQVTYAGDGDVIAARNFLASVTWNPVTVSTQDETTAYIKANIANPGDPILNP